LYIKHRFRAIRVVWNYSRLWDILLFCTTSLLLFVDLVLAIIDQWIFPVSSLSATVATAWAFYVLFIDSLLSGILLRVLIKSTNELKSILNISNNDPSSRDTKKLTRILVIMYIIPWIAMIVGFARFNSDVDTVLYLSQVEQLAIPAQAAVALRYVKFIGIVMKPVVNAAELGSNPSNPQNSSHGSAIVKIKTNSNSNSNSKQQIIASQTMDMMSPQNSSAQLNPFKLEVITKEEIY